MKNAMFNLGIALFFTHELDAMTHKEWLVLPLTSWLPDQTGQSVFVLTHIPIFAVIIALLSSDNDVIRSKTKFYIALFLALHGGLHTLFITHEHYHFHNGLSNLLIFGGAICGAVYLALNKKARRS